MQMKSSFHRMNAMLLRRLVHNVVLEMRVLMMRGILVWWCPVQMEVHIHVVKENTIPSCDL